MLLIMHTLTDRHGAHQTNIMDMTAENLVSMSGEDSTEQTKAMDMT